MKKTEVVEVLGAGALIIVLMVFCLAGAAIQRYPVGQPVTSSVYTEPFDPCDPAYKFLQAPPKDWAEKFGNSERTMLIHAVSELRVVVAVQGQRLLALEEWQKKQPAFDPNHTGDLSTVWMRPDANGILYLAGKSKDPNEAKR